MARPRWTQKIGRKTARKEAGKQRAVYTAGNRDVKATYDELRAAGHTTTTDAFGRHRWASGPYRGKLVGHLNRDPFRYRPAKAGERRRDAWSLRANNVGRDKRTGRFKRR